MLIISIRIIISNIFFQFISIKFSIVSWNSKNFMPCIFNCASFVQGNMTCNRSNNSFKRFKYRINYKLICLCSSGNKPNVSFRTFTGSFYFCLCTFTIFISSITRKLFHISFCQAFQNLFVRTFNIITFKRNHKSSNILSNFQFSQNQIHVWDFTTQ